MPDNSLNEDFTKKEVISPFKWWESRRKNFNKKVLITVSIGCLIDIIFRHSLFDPTDYSKWFGNALGIYLGMLVITNIIFSIPEFIEIIYKWLNKNTFNNKSRVIFEKILTLIIVFLVLIFIITYH